MKQTAGKVAIGGKHIVKDSRLGDTTTRVLKDILLQIMQGESVLMMGPSGFGKSTLPYILGGPDASTGDQVLLDGTDISQSRDEKMGRIRWQNIGLVSQSYNLIPSLNVEENILLPLLLDRKKTEQCQEKLERVLEVAGPTERRRHTPCELSGDQQQWVAIARALIGESAILLVGRPTGNLDSRTGIGIVDLLQEISQSTGQAIIMMTYSPEAAKSSSWIVTVQNGVLVREEDVQADFSMV